MKSARAANIGGGVVMVVVAVLNIVVGVIFAVLNATGCSGDL